jgi:transcription-repair coupling factor (superfamily II helicase)
LRIAANRVGVARVDATHESVQLQFVKNPPIDGGKVIALVQRRKDLRLSGPEKLRLAAKMPGWPERAQAVKDLLGQLAA